MESIVEIKQTLFPEQVNEALEAEDPRVRIMIIDDDLDVIDALTALLKRHHRVISCSNLEEAHGSMTPDIKLVLLDIKMGSKDGIEVFKSLKEQYSDLPIVFHSAYQGSSEKVAELERLGHNGSLTKGEYDLPELLRVITHATNSSRDGGFMAAEELRKPR
jgi:CheY-like chemotaxis protein